MRENVQKIETGRNDTEKQPRFYMKKKDNFWILIIIYNILGLICLPSAFYSIYSIRNFLATSLKAEGEIVEIVVTYSIGKGRYTYSPKVSFVDQSGKQVTFVSDASRGFHSQFDIGEKVPILYDPSTPEHAKINKFFDIWLVTIILSFTGFMFTFLGITGILLKYRKKL